MVKRISAFVLFYLTAGILLAQDMPPLPALPDQNVSAGGTVNVTASTPALPPLPSSSSEPSSPAMPALPDTSAPSGSPVPSLPPLPSSSTATANNSGSPSLPPLPGASNAPANNSSPAMPPLPGQPEASTTAPAAASTPANPGQANAEAVPEKKFKNKHHKSERPWEATKWRPNVIFGGWVNSKGGNETSRLAWTSQEVMNALCFKGYKVLKEDGKYPGQAGAGGHQWREITFSVPKSELKVQVYAKQSGRKVWLRVGPSEPPAFAIPENTIVHVQKMREADLKALHLIKKELGRRLLAHRFVPSWEAPYSFNKETVVE